MKIKELLNNKFSIIIDESERDELIKGIYPQINWNETVKQLFNLMRGTEK